ncbi:MAG TPA: ATP-binding protein [Anaerolineae bacterium]|nr:ATP-binding protein [Anaerolineae bacterium]HQH37113.1 ATP-binding protein [Anaerolineae bacterium]
MEDFEKLGVFYLGKEYDLTKKAAKDTLLLYDSKDLVTHAVTVGMTGSGKTGLCIDLIEEAAIDGIPAIVIDPKGDLGNLLLTFPQLRGEDFLPWINEDDARQKGMTPQAYAEAQAALWKKGLADWGQDGARIQKLRDAADFVIYTPASNAGVPVSILKSFAAPSAAVLEDGEMMRERVGTTVTSLLGLLGIEADPVQSREYILLSTILDFMWRQGHDVDLAALIQLVQTPPMTKIGVLDLDSFYPAKDRFGLVMALNNLLASPGFSAWLEGEPLDIGQILYTPQGKPRIAIFSIAHLGDPERMFFVSLLLNQVLSWMRGLSGTTSLRALLYIDEIFGYLPPIGNPPSKLPLLTMLKQARAFGVGVVLATQNPVDLDYKALSNAGTWFIGRLQTERDKARLLDGLEGAAASLGGRFDRRAMEQTLAGLGSRVFLMNNVHEDAPVVFTTRWAMSYLRGPITREQIRVLMAPRKAASAVAAPTYAPTAGITATTPVAPTTVTAPTIVAPTTAAAPLPPAPAPGAAPMLPPDVSRFFVPVRGSRRSRTVIYKPYLLGAARVHFVDTRLNIDLATDIVAVTPIVDTPLPVDWEQAQTLDLAVTDLEKTGEPDASYGTLPAAAAQARNYTAWNRDFTTWVYGTQRLTLLRSPALKQTSEPGESERDFRLRMQQLAREQRDGAVDALRQKYAPRLTALQERLRKAQQAVEREQSQARQAGLQTAVNVGSTLLGALMGRKAVSASTVGKAATTAKSVGRASQQREDVARAEETVEVLQKQLADLQAEFDAETARLTASIDPLTEELTPVIVKPKKTDITVPLVSLVWMPYWQDEQGGLLAGW